MLTDHATVVMSGTKLAAELRTTRSAVWRMVQQLRALGVDVAGHSATGYQLKTVPDLLLPDVLDPLLRGTRFTGKLHHYFKIDSTSTAAMAAAASDAPEGSVFLAEQQTSGRGRAGHTWHSERSAGIYFSAVLRPRMAPADVLLLSLASGLAVRAAITEVTGVAADLRWPNDVLIGEGAAGKKVCGILIEINAEATRLRHAVVGIGLNVNHGELPEALKKEATSLRLATGQRWSRVELEAAVLKSLDREYSQLLDPRRRSGIRERFEAASSYARGMQVQVEEDGGFKGTTEGLDERGFLRVRTPDGVRTVLSGGVRPASQAN